MSEFDKEAEREKLREKYEQDEQDRENTRRMSELLLQGATMTGKHCGACGDPIFRYDGQEFCPTCQREVEGSGAQQGGGGAQQGGTPHQAPAESGGEATEGSTTAGTDAVESNPDGAGGVTEDAEEVGEKTTDETGDERATASDDEPRVEINDVRVADEHADPSNVRRPPSQQGESADRSRGSPSRTDERRRTRRRGHDHHDHHPDAGHDHHPDAGSHAPTRDAGDLATAREALVRKLTDLARRAEETDDVARARDLLAATREAAEALAALDRANR